MTAKSSVYGVYKQGWLEEFFEALTENKDWLHSVTYGEYLERATSRGKVYLPTASYEEMMEWALPTPMQRRMNKLRRTLESDPARADEKEFIRGGFWRSFLTKYPESNNMQKRMLRVSARLERLRGCADTQVDEAERLLHQGQCNCAYWHGVFGGLYLNHLRTAVYEKLIAADAMLDKVEHLDETWANCETVDFDLDGSPEAVLENTHLALVIDPGDGGTLVELDYKDKPFNFGNTLTRREEQYHDALRQDEAVLAGEADTGEHSIHELVRVKERGLDKYLVYDPYRRVSFRDHFLADNTTAKTLWAGTHAESGGFATGRYEVQTQDNSAILSSRGTVNTGAGSHAVTVVKTFQLKPGSSRFEVRYDILNESDKPLSVLFGVELAVNLLSGSSFDRYYRSEDKDLGNAKLGSQGCEAGISHLALRDDWQHLECGFMFPDADRVYRFAIETVSQSEGGQERVYQGSIVVPCWRLAIPAGKSATPAVYTYIDEV